MKNGEVKWFNEAKGYGFIVSGDVDYFVHYSEIQAQGFKTMREGDKVSFVPESGQKGNIAKNVMVEA